jgi:signal peptidase I
VSLAYLASVAGALLLGQFLANGLFLWLACRWLGVAGVRYLRAFSVAVLAWLLTGVIPAVVLTLAGGLPGGGPAAKPIVLLAGALVGLLLTAAVWLLCVKGLLGKPRPSLGKAVLVTLVWGGLQLVFGAALLAGLYSQAQAFVVPTGAMAVTLRGWHKLVVCPQCGHQFAVNASQEAEQPDDRPLVVVAGCTCPNCRSHIDIAAAPQGGDRFLAGKTALLGGGRRERFDILVFHYPVAPDREIYNKRLVGLPGETLGIHGGKLYVATGTEHKDDAPPDDLWHKEYMHQDEDREALENRVHGKPGTPEFHIVRKPLEQVLALRHLVYDNDRPAMDLADKPRWSAPDGGWEADQTHGFRHTPRDAEAAVWLSYQHLLRGHDRPELITDFIGYNTGEPHTNRLPEPNWVGDLMLEAEVAVEAEQGDLVLELARGVDRFEARWDLATGLCTLARLHAGNKDQLGEARQTALKGKSTHRLRFADVDERLTVWVDDTLPFGEGVAYDPAARSGPTRDDLQPVRIGVRNAAVSAHHLKLWRDTYHTLEPGQADARAEDWSDPAAWDELRNLRGKTFYVQPGHYFCVGDNSPESSDSRLWGLVPERLVIGRGLTIYYPFSRAGPLR